MLLEMMMELFSLNWLLLISSKNISQSNCIRESTWLCG